MICPNVVIVASSFVYDRLDMAIRRQGMVSKGIVIGKDVCLGAGCLVLDGATIADGTVVMGGSGYS